ncbi:hypothetical protein C8R47DRAFT_1297427 [Mycena vitilis]|nr:hypothetical protein C8R47DRAFT_1297427 [Mycena vitilis]
MRMATLISRISTKARGSIGSHLLSTPVPGMAETLRTHLLKAHLAYYHSCQYTLSSYDAWRWVKRGVGLNAQIASGRMSTGCGQHKPIRFSVFGMVKRTARSNVVILERPQWSPMDVVCRELTLHYDMQLLTLARVLDYHGWEPDIPGDEIVLTVEEGTLQIEEGSIFFATALLTVREEVDDATSEAYLLDFTHSPLRTMNSSSGLPSSGHISLMDFMFNDFASRDNEDSLAKGVLHLNFGPTRERSFQASSFFTNKNCQDEVPASQEFRGILTEYNPSVFGQVAEYFDTPTGIEFKMICPDGLNSAQEGIYVKQVDALEAIIQKELCQDGGTVTNSWLGEHSFVVHLARET